MRRMDPISNFKLISFFPYQEMSKETYNSSANESRDTPSIRDLSGEFCRGLLQWQPDEEGVYTPYHTSECEDHSDEIGDIPNREAGKHANYTIEDRSEGIGGWWGEILALLVWLYEDSVSAYNRNVRILLRSLKEQRDDRPFQPFRLSLVLHCLCTLEALISSSALVPCCRSPLPFASLKPFPSFTASFSSPWSGDCAVLWTDNGRVLAVGFKVWKGPVSVPLLWCLAENGRTMLNATI